MIKVKLAAGNLLTEVAEVKRVMLFIDGSNFYHNLKQHYKKTQIDFALLVDKLTGNDRELIRTYYYNSPIDRNMNEEEYRKQQKFFERIKRIDCFEIKLGRLQNNEDGSKKEKGTDVNIAVDMITKAYKDQYDVAILISGDADLAQVVQEVKDLAKHVELVVVPGQKCYHLRDTVDRVITIDKTYDDCWL